VPDFTDYCRRIETYLCGKNGGHLIRIVGPAFERVCGWAEQGVPLKIAFRGIDQYCERYYAKGPRRRPARIEFCEADILDLFDDWRRAIGVVGGEEGEEPLARPPRKPSLASHVNRVLVRLSSIRAMAHLAPAVAEEIDAVIADLDRVAPLAAHARGDVRAQIVDALASLDRRLIAAAEQAVEPGAAASLRQEAEAELAGFGARMPPEVRARATDAAFARLVRESLNLPVVSYE
jgi:hypothetical protein